MFFLIIALLFYAILTSEVFPICYHTASLCKELSYYDLIETNIYNIFAMCISSSLCDRRQMFLIPVCFYFLTLTGGLNRAGKSGTFYFQGNHHMYAVFVGIFAAITGGISFCCIRAASKDSNQPM